MADLDLNTMIWALPVEGGRIELPPGEFDLVPPAPPPGAPPGWRPSAAVVVDRPVEILGAGPAFGARSPTVLLVPRGVTHGFELLGNIAYREGRAAYAAGARRSRLSGFALTPKARAGPGDESKAYTFGITIRAGSVELSNLHVQDAVEHNIQIISEGITVEGRTFVDVADHWFMHHVRTQGAGLDGIYINGTDAHIGTALQVDAVNNGRWGINDSSSFGNTHIGHHTRGNGYNPDQGFEVTILEIVGNTLTIDHRRTDWDPNPKDSTGWLEFARLHERDDPGSHARDENIPGPKVVGVIFHDPTGAATRVKVDSLDLFRPTPRADGSFERIGELRVGPERAFNAKYGGGYYSNSSSTYGTWIGCYAEVDQSFLLACQQDGMGGAGSVRGQALVLGGGVSAQTNALQVVGNSRSKFYEKALATVKSPDIAAAHLRATRLIRPSLESSGPWGDAEGSPRKILTSSEADHPFRAVRQFQYNAKYLHNGEYLNRQPWSLLEPYRGLWRAWEWLEDSWFLVRRQRRAVPPLQAPEEVPYSFTDEDHPHGPSHPIQGWSRVSSPFRFCLTKRFEIAAPDEWEQVTVAGDYLRDIIPERPASGERPARRKFTYPGTLALSLTVKGPSGSKAVELGSYEHDGTTGTLRAWVRTCEPVPSTGPANLPYLMTILGERYQVSFETRASTTGALPAFFTASDGVLSAAAPGRFPDQDGITLAFGDSLLVKDEPAPQHNGVYVLTGAGDALTPWKLQRRSDFDEAGDVRSGAVVVVFEGTTNGASQWVLTASGTITIGSTPLTFWRSA